MPAQDRPVLFLPDEPSFRDWFATSHASADGVWPQGLMHPAGQAEIDRAKADGRGHGAYGAGQRFVDGRTLG
ncbi:hypothetical protein ACW2Q0_17985 [Nocardia sp. R16R-3T]